MSIISNKHELLADRLNLSKFAIYPVRISEARKQLAAEPSNILAALSILLETNGQEVDGLTTALIRIRGEEQFLDAFAKDLAVDRDESRRFFKYYKENRWQAPLMLTGAETVALLLWTFGVEYAIAYAGTSELALCDAIARIDDMKILNSRGDKECAFIAGGANILYPGRAVAVLHAARGLTNAAGAIADMHRNEIGVLCLIGLPSTQSSRYLPPHAEPEIIKKMGAFAKAAFDTAELINESNYIALAQDNSHRFIQEVQRCFANSTSIPPGPVLLGLPQDVLERRWIPYELLELEEKLTPFIISPTMDLIERAVKVIQCSQNPIILVDDPLFRREACKGILLEFADTIAAPIFQVEYSRGPMLFESINPSQSTLFIGPYKPSEPTHTQFIQRADLLITLEDRNAYPRVVGNLPNCRKIAVSSNPEMTLKNEYLKADDILIYGEPENVLLAIISRLMPMMQAKEIEKVRMHCKEMRESHVSRTIVDPPYDFFRFGLIEKIANFMKEGESTILVDDSQMFGAVLWQNYDKLPPNIRVVGDHGGFVGAGIAYAVGIALGSTHEAVWCTLGDQAFSNGFQALVSAVEIGKRIIFLLCNNGGSISLTKQATSRDIFAFDRGTHPFLKNAANLDYCSLAQAFGLTIFRVDIDPVSESDILKSQEMLAEALRSAQSSKGPVLIELKVPSDVAAWRGIWSVKGYDEG